MAEMYSGFAAVYDALMDNIPYDEWFSYLHTLLQENGVYDGLLAELGCGTGSMTERLSMSGYDVIGIDNSPAMLDIANEKKVRNHTETLYLLQDMREFELYGTVRACISVCDSINYITDTDALVHVFSLVNNYLDPHGIFIFDFHTRHYYRDIVADATIAEDREDISFIWDNYYDEEASENELSLSLFLRDKRAPEDNVYHKYEELHIQRGYTLEEMRACVRASGLTLLAEYDAFTHEPATEQCERIYIVAQEARVPGSTKQYFDSI